MKIINLFMLLVLINSLFACSFILPSTTKVVSPFIVRLNVSNVQTFNFSVANLKINDSDYFYLYLPAGTYDLKLNCSYPNGTLVQRNLTIQEISNLKMDNKVNPYNVEANGTIYEVLTNVKEVRFGFINANVFEFIVLVIALINYIYIQAEPLTRITVSAFSGFILFLIFYIIGLVSFSYVLLFALILAFGIAYMYIGK